MKSQEYSRRLLPITALVVLLTALPSYGEGSKSKMLTRVNGQINNYQGRISTLNGQSSDLQSKSSDLSDQIAAAKSQMEADTAAIKKKRDRLNYIEESKLRDVADGEDIAAQQEKIVTDQFRLKQMRDKHLDPIRKRKTYLALVNKRKDMEFDLDLARASGNGDRLARETKAVMAVEEQIVAYEDKALLTNDKYKALSTDIEARQSRLNALRATAIAALAENTEWVELNLAVQNEQRALSQASAAAQRLMREKHQADLRITRNNAQVTSLSKKVASLEKQKATLEIALAHDMVDSTD